MKFRYSRRAYKTYQRPAPEIKYSIQPLVKMSVDIGGNWFPTEALVDTGCQYCLFGPSVAKVIGIKDISDTSESQALHGVGGSGIQNKAYFHKVNINIYRDTSHFDKKNTWKYETKVGFLEEEAIMPAILGMYGFFDRFNFKSNLWENYFELDYIAEASS